MTLRVLRHALDRSGLPARAYGSGSPAGPRDDAPPAEPDRAPARRA